MLRPFLLVGVGGSGGKTLRGIRKALQLKLEQEHWRGGWPDAWQFLHIDSPISQDGLDFPAPLLPLDQYLSLVPAGVGYETVYGSVKSRVDGKNVADMERALPSPMDVNVPIHMGAGAFRAIGRTISAAMLGEIQDKLEAVLGQMTTATASGQLAELTRHLGIPVAGAMPPTAVIVSSIAGGSGAGQFMDVAEAIKSAADNDPWTEDIFALLYAPDVFDKLGRREIPANALGAISETMSGIWNRKLSNATAALYQGHGLIASASPKYRIGPAYPYVLGASNGLVSFGEQNDVYLAVSSSIATWMVDNKVQDKLSAYTVTNYSAKAPTLPDNTGLRKTGGDSPEPSPFSSMGFGRVSLGLERFYEYAAERLAKSALNALLYKHVEQDQLLAQKTEEQWRQDNADLAFGAFLSDSGLDQQTHDNNQLLNALRPDTSEVQARMKAAIEQMARGGMPKGGHPYSAWVERIYNGYEVNIPSLLADNRNDLLAKVRNWVDYMPGQILRLTAQTISRQGMPVTVELINRTIQHSMQSLTELKQESRQYLAEAESLKTLITQSMQAASNMANVPPNNPAVAQGIHQAQLALIRRAESDLREVAGEILEDFVRNFLEPLRQTLAGSANALREGVNDQKLPDGRTNPFSSWPDEKDAAAPKRFYPAPNERMLIDVKDYPSVFDKLVTQTVGDSKKDAKRVVLDELIMGDYGIEALEGLRPDQRWTIIELDQIWVPQERLYQSQEGAFQAARFGFLTNHMSYVDRAKLWLSIPGRTFSAFLDQTLIEWLSDDSDRSVYAERQAKFVKEFDAAVASAAPLVSRNQKLLVSVHPPQIGLDATEDDLLFSGIPVSTTDELFEPLKNVLIKYHEWRPSFEDFFVGRSGAANARQIDVFSVTSVPVQPMTLESVMQPIAQEWLSSSVTKDGRGNFIQWRRGRPLEESIPASPDIWRQMLAGWYVCKMFGLIRAQKDHNDPSFDQKGPRLSMWVDGGKQWVDFPYPLYYPGIAPTPDYPGIALESLTVALVNSYSQSSLDPLLPYQVLRDMGDLDSSDGALRTWIKKGITRDSDAPTPREAWAGTATQTAEERKATCLAYFESQLADFNHYMDRQDKHGDVRNYPVSWQIREPIREGLQRIIQTIPSMEEYDDDDEYA